MKKLFPLLTFVVFVLSGLGTSALAVTTANTFNVTANLTAQCLINTAASALDFGTYTAFGSASNSAPTTAISFKCSKGTALTSVAFDTGSGSGVVMGLAYTMTVGTGVLVSGTAATATVGATADVTTYTVTGGMASGQAGAGSGSASVLRTLTLTY